MIEIDGAHSVRMKLDAAEVDDPGEAGGVVYDDFFRRPSGREGERHRAQPRWASFWRALLVEGFGFGAVDEALQCHGPVADAGKRPVGYGEIILHDVELRELHLAREVWL